MNKSFFLDTKNLLLNFLGIISLLIIITLNSCEEDPSSLGSEILPDSDKLEYHFDSSFTFRGNIYEDEPINTSNLSYYSLGVINDEEHFGKFSSEYLGQFLPDIYYAYFEGNFIDSGIVYIQIDSIYGDPINDVSFNLYELTEAIEEDASYLSNTDVSDFYSPTLISGNSTYLSDTLIKLRLTNNYIEKLTTTEDSVYNTSVNFKSAIYGIALVPNLLSNPGGLVTTNFSSANSKIVLYFNDTTFTYHFSSGHGFAKNTNDFTNTQAEYYLNNSDTVNDDLLYVQGITSLKSKISFTNIDSYLESDSSYSVLSAELLLPVYEDDYFDLFYPPKRLYLLYDNADSTYSYVKDCEDDVRGGVKIFDGYYNDENKNYHFYLSRHMLRLLNQDIESKNLYISAARPSFNTTTYTYNYNYYPQRVILKTGDNIKFQITYTKH